VSFTGYRLDRLRVPLNGPKGQEFATVLGGAQDAELALLQTAGRLHSTSKAPEDGLDDLGSLYGRSRAPRELWSQPLHGTYRARLAQAWPFWESAPTAGSATLGLASLFTAYLDAFASRNFTVPPAQVISGSAAGWPQFSEIVIVWPSTLQPDDTWDSVDLLGGAPVYDDGGIWDIEFTPSAPNADPSFGVADLDWLRREIRTCKGGQAYPVTIAVGLGFDSKGASALWDDGTAWDDGGTWDDASVAGLYTYLPLGHVWGEEALYGGAWSAWDSDPADVWDDFIAPSGGW
jgi:hypothetical protein